MITLPPPSPPDPRLAPTLAWLQPKLPALDHELRVARIAATLFDLTAPFHQLPPGAAQLLHLAALLHDVGRSLHNSEHAALGATMVLSDSRLPLSPAHRRHLAFLIRYHRGRVPKPAAEAILIPTDDRPTLRLLLALLRAADALDSRSLHSPHLVFALRHRRLEIQCYLDPAAPSVSSPQARRAFLRRKKFHLLEDELQIRLEVDLRPPATLHLVA